MWPERRKKAPFNKDIEWLGISVLRKGSFNGWKVVDGYTFLKPEDGDAWNTSPTLEFKEAFSIPHQNLTPLAEVLLVGQDCKFTNHTTHLL